MIASILYIIIIEHHQIQQHQLKDHDKRPVIIANRMSAAEKRRPYIKVLQGWDFGAFSGPQERFPDAKLTGDPGCQSDFFISINVVVAYFRQTAASHSSHTPRMYRYTAIPGGTPQLNFHQRWIRGPNKSDGGGIRCIDVGPRRLSR